MGATMALEGAGLLVLLVQTAPTTFLIEVVPPVGEAVFVAVVAGEVLMEGMAAVVVVSRRYAIKFSSPELRPRSETPRAHHVQNDA